ncbi:hypothetical protein ACFL12_00460 [Pseudomonadota bacterium]
MGQFDLFLSEKTTPPHKKPVKPAIKRLRGFQKVALVFDELSKQVGGEFSSAELLRAAQELIRYSKGDYTDQVSKEHKGSQHYFARDVCTVFSNYQSQVLIFENAIMMHCDVPDYTDEALDRFRVINLCLNEQKWEF